MVTATLMVHNAGDFPVGSFDVALYTGDPEDRGVLVATHRVTGPFAAGSRLPIPFTFVYPASGGDIAAVIDAAAEVTELTEGNNIATCHLANRPPQAVILATATSGLRPLSIELDASASYDPDGDALRFDWSFGDGGTSSGPAVVSHVFTRSGRFPVAVIVTDSKGATGTAIVMVTIDDIAPAAPENLQATAGSAMEIVLTWQDGSDNETGFRIYRGVHEGALSLVTEVGANVTTWTDQGLAPATAYDDQVEAFNAYGTSSRSNTATATTPALDAGTDFHTLTPCRVFDSRTSGNGQPLTSDVPRIFQAAGVCAIPSTAVAIAVNVTVVSPTDRGRVTLYPGGIDAPVTSTLNFLAGANRANNAIIPLASDGSGTLSSLAFVVGGGTVHLIVDVNGYFE
jgi:PKD repeat protein